MKKPTVRRVLLAIAAVLVVGALYWFQLPPLNLRSPDCWAFLFEVLAVALAAVVLGRIFTGKGGAPEVVMTEHGPRVSMPRRVPSCSAEPCGVWWWAWVRLLLSVWWAA